MADEHEDKTVTELKEEAAARGVEVETGDKKADLVEKLEEADEAGIPAATLPFDPKNPGGQSFDYGEAEASEDDFDPDNPGGQAMGVPPPPSE